MYAPSFKARVGQCLAHGEKVDSLQVGEHLMKARLMQDGHNAGDL